MTAEHATPRSRIGELRRRPAGLQSTAAAGDAGGGVEWAILDSNQ